MKIRQSFSTKGQGMSVELIFAIAIFVFVVLGLIALYNTSTTRAQELLDQQDLDRVALHSYLSLLTRQGDPPEWHTLALTSANISAVRSLGIAHQRFGLVDAQRADELDRMNLTAYDQLKAPLGILGPDYEFYLALYQYSNVTQDYLETPSYAIGQPTNATDAVRQVGYFVLANKTWVTVEYIVYRE